jgi:hypothetical protein
MRNSISTLVRISRGLNTMSFSGSDLRGSHLKKDSWDALCKIPGDANWAIDDSIGTAQGDHDFYEARAVYYPS